MLLKKENLVVIIVDISWMKSQLKNTQAKLKNAIVKDLNKVFCWIEGTLVPPNLVSKLNKFLIF